MYRRALVLGLLSITLLTTAGCGRKKVTTAPEAAPQPPAMADTAPAQPAPPPAAPVDPVEADPLSGDLAAVNEYLRRQGLLQDTYFAYDRAELTEPAREQLSRNAQFLKQYPQFQVTLEGHCDDRGTPEYNLALGEQRASSVRDYLTALGVRQDRLRIISYGEERPVCTGLEESCRSQNRRAHPVVTGRSGG
jgi:peptidoglycan-associated lipoprotein